MLDFPNKVIFSKSIDIVCSNDNSKSSGNYRSSDIWYQWNQLIYSGWVIFWYGAK